MKTIWIFTYTEVFRRSATPIVIVSLFTNYEDARAQAEAFHNEFKSSESLNEIAAYFDMNYNNCDGKGIWIQYSDLRKTYQIEVKAQTI